MNVTDRPVLILNRNYVATKVKSVQEVLPMIFTGVCMPLIFENNQYWPVSWEDWVKLPTEGHPTIHTPKMVIRVPVVVLLKKYAHVQLKVPTLNMDNLRKVYGNRCIYSNEVISREESSMEHVRPASWKGQRTWDNIGLAKKRTNNKRGNKPLREAGLKLKVKLRQPKPLTPAEEIVNYCNYPEWNFFIKKSA